MGLFIRSSTSMLWCAKRMLSNNTAIASVQTNSANYPKVFNHKIFQAIVNSDLVINKKMKNNEIMEDDQWAALRKQLQDTYKLTEVNVDSKIYNICEFYNRNDEAVRYFKFLKRNNYEIPLVITGSYLRIFYTNNKPISDEEEEEICQIYDNMRKKYPLLDGKTCSDCILALSLTKRWKETLDLVEMLKITMSPGIKVMSAIIAAAFRNKEISIGWKIMTESIETNPLESQVYEEYLNYCKKNVAQNKLQIEVEKIFNFWRDYDVKPKENIFIEYKDLFKSFGYDVQSTTVSNKGECSYCKHMLQATTLSKNDFKLLSTTVLKNLIVGKNVYCATSPQELKRYLIFVKTMKPYDVVIDGLNVAYAARKPNEPGSLQSVLNVVNYFYKAKKRVLVIGRAHMNWWSKDGMKAVQEKADVFLTKNLSQDDPFLLHVTLLSGPQTYFVSRDLMRQHKHKLVDSDLQIMFRRWQLSRQYMFAKKYNSNDIHLIPPLNFEVSAQKYKDNWHIPYSMHAALKVRQEYSVPSNWICLKKNNK